MIEVLLALVIGYVIGLMQNGITIKHKDEEVPKEYNKSVGLDHYKDYYERNEGVNKF